MNDKIKTLHIMRGVPGTGKSTFIKHNIKVADEDIHSTDNVVENEIAPKVTGLSGIEAYKAFFKKMNDSGDFTLFSRAHSINLKNAQESMDKGAETVVIDNTNLNPWEPKKYVEYALEKGYKIQINNIPLNGLEASDLFKRNVHNVPLEAIKKMIQRFKQNPTLSVKQILDAKNR